MSKRCFIRVTLLPEDILSFGPGGPLADAVRIASGPYLPKAGNSRQQENRGFLNPRGKSHTGKPLVEDKGLYPPSTASRCKFSTGGITLTEVTSSTEVELSERLGR